MKKTNKKYKISFFVALIRQNIQWNVPLNDTGSSWLVLLFDWFQFLTCLKYWGRIRNFFLDPEILKKSELDPNLYKSLRIHKTAFNCTNLEDVVTGVGVEVARLIQQGGSHHDLAAGNIGRPHPAAGTVDVERAAVRQRLGHQEAQRGRVSLWSVEMVPRIGHGRH